MMTRSGYRTVVTVEPTEEPITVAEAKLHCRIDHDDEDNWFTDAVKAARQWCENQTRRRFVNTTIRLSMDSFPQVIRLPGGKCQSVTSITYVDTDGATQTVDTSVYTLDSDSEPARIVQAYGQFWPAIREVPNSVKVTYVAGYGSSAASVPAGIKHAIKLIVEQQNLFRSPAISGTIITEVPMSVHGLLDPFRISEFQ